MKYFLASLVCILGYFMLLSNKPPSTPAVLAASPQFNPGCTLPFDDIKERHSLDDSCSAEGSPGGAENREQNRIKNNFCASGDTTRLTFLSFKRLQRIVDDKGVRYGSGLSLPQDRSVLRNIYVTSEGRKIGEGDRIMFVAFIVDAHHSNLSKGESVNCKKGGEANNDIHIALGQSADDDLCDTVTAEISPHFRPEPWNELAHTNLGKRPVRLTGQLFFDASHKPCRGNKRPSPQRVSVWEIHPVYALDVCQFRTLSRCKWNDNTVWTPLHEWMSSDDDNDR